MDLTVVDKKIVGASIAVVDLAMPDGCPLPPWSPGSHIEVTLPTDQGALVRQYSLCAAEDDPSIWRIAVLREAKGRGGSAFICDRVERGQSLHVSGPRNLFEFTPRGRITFIAGGIGITPILPMVLRAERMSLDWRLIYLARERSNIVFAETIARLPQGRVSIHCSGESGRFDLAAEMGALGAQDSVYACGPMRLLDDLEALNAARGAAWSLHLERFENPNKAAAGPDAPFDVILARSNRRFTVQPGETILDVLSRNGVSVTASCRDGLCSTCEQRVVDGLPDHRDAVLTPEERKENAYMMICVSRSLTPTLTLDL